METLAIKEILNAIGGALIQGDPCQCIQSVSTDSRTAHSGQLFIPLLGENFDAHEFIPQAIERGVRVILTQQKRDSWPSHVNVIYVQNTLHSLQKLAAFYRRRFDIPVVAVTGSTGKTTTKDMIASVLSSRYNVLKTQGNYNNEIGLPLTLLQLNNDHQIAVLEMGMRGLGEIRELANIALPDIGVITNIGVSHIERLGSRQNIFKAKMEIFSSFESSGCAFLNGDDELLWGVKKNFPYCLQYFGTNQGVDFRAVDIHVRGEEVDFKVDIDKRVYPVHLAVPGKHNVYNALAAIAVGSYLELDMDDIQQGLNDFVPSGMRLNIFTTAQGVKIIDDVYNANPDSMKASLAILRDLGGNRKIAVLGDMLEMGEYAEEEHRAIGTTVVDYQIDFLITQGSKSRWIAEQASQEGMSSSRIFHFYDNQSVNSYLKKVVYEGDTVLVKGSRGMKMEEIVSYLTNLKDE